MGTTKDGDADRPHTVDADADAVAGRIVVKSGGAIMFDESDVPTPDEEGREGVADDG